MISCASYLIDKIKILNEIEDCHLRLMGLVGSMNIPENLSVMSAWCETYTVRHKRVDDTDCYAVYGFNTCVTVSIDHVSKVIGMTVWSDKDKELARMTMYMGFPETTSEAMSYTGITSAGDYSLELIRDSIRTCIDECMKKKEEGKE